MRCGRAIRTRTWGWRPGARHEIVLIADNIPHDPNLNEGLPESEWICTLSTPAKNPLSRRGSKTPFGRPGPTRRSCLWPSVSAPMRRCSRISSSTSSEGLVNYWQHWAALTGGTALAGSSGGLGSGLRTLIEDGACGAKCPEPPAAPHIVAPSFSSARTGGRVKDERATLPRDVGSLRVDHGRAFSTTRLLIDELRPGEHVAFHCLHCVGRRKRGRDRCANTKGRPVRGTSRPHRPFAVGVHRNGS